MASLDAYILTFNCGRTLIQPEIFSEHLWNATDSKPQILVLCLQEIAPISYSFLGGSFLTPYFNSFRQAVKLASKDVNYINLITRNVGLTGIMIFFREDTVSNIEWLQTAGVGVGVQEMGNKGAAAVRVGYRAQDDEVISLTFVSAHLAPMEEALQRRNEDYENIAKGLVFHSEIPRKPPSEDEQEEHAPLLQGLTDETSSSQSSIYATSYLFFAGDLNYRTSERKPTAEDVKTFPTMTTDAENPGHFSKLLNRDQLTHQLNAKKTLLGMTEAPINFHPTYKYQESTAPQGEQNWKWASHRWPSWCDRILYLDCPSTMAPTKIQVHSYNALPLFATSDHRPVALSASIPLQAIVTPTDENDKIRDAPPFSTDFQWKDKRGAARRKEIVVGVVAYLGLTWEGNGLIMATICTAVVISWLVTSSNNAA